MIVTEICTLAFTHCLNTVTGENKHILFCSLHVLQCFDFFSSFFFNNIGTMAVLVKDIFFVFGGLKIAVMEHLLHVQFWATVSVTLIIQSHVLQFFIFFVGNTTSRGFNSETALLFDLRFLTCRLVHSVESQTVDVSQQTQVK